MRGLRSESMKARPREEWIPIAHSMQPDENSPFQYATGGINFDRVKVTFRPTELFEHLSPFPQRMAYALQTQINVVYEIYVQLEVIKHDIHQDHVP